MNTIQIWAAITVPTAAILIAILVSNNSVSKNVDTLRADMGTLRSDMGTFRSEMNALRSEVLARISKTETELLNRINNIDSHLLQFFQITGKLEGRVDEISKKAS